MTVLISTLSRLTLMAMIAFEVTLNGKRVCIAGAEDLSVLNASVTASGRLGKKTIPVRPNETYDIHYTVGGLTSRRDPRKDVHLRWRQIEWLRIGDIVQIKIIQTNQSDRPKSKTKAPRQTPRSHGLQKTSNGKVKQLNESSVDATILALVQPHWKKVAMIIALTADKLRPHLPEADEGYHLIAKRIQALVRNKRLLYQGDLKKWRHSEVRLP